ncbi:MAG: hypothetical protein Q9157_007708 [Trypethelium eluteriae]
MADDELERTTCQINASLERNQLITELTAAGSMATQKADQRAEKSSSERETEARESKECQRYLG